MYVYTYVCTYLLRIPMPVCVYGSVHHIHTYVRTYVCVYVGVYVCKVCMKLRVCTYVRMYRFAY